MKKAYGTFGTTLEANVSVTGIDEELEKVNQIESTFKDIITESFPNLQNYPGLQTQVQGSLVSEPSLPQTFYG